jgi:hypothetical protein
VQALYDAAGLGPLNFKFRSPYNWHLMKSRPTAFGDNKNRPGKTYVKVDMKAAEEKVLNELINDSERTSGDEVQGGSVD